MKCLHQTKKCSSVAAPLVLCLFTSISAATRGLGQSQPQESVVPTDPRQKIGVLITQTLDKRELISPQGTRVWAPVQPAGEVVREIRKYGDRAVPILAEFLASGSLHERELAMEFLSYIDSARSIEQVLLAARDDSDSGVRKQGLRYLIEKSWEVAQPPLQHASQADPDPRQREFAEQALAGHEGRNMESPSAAFVHDRIARMIDYIVRRSEFVLADGVRITIVPLPEMDETREIKHYGDRAVPTLSQYLSEDRYDKYLVMRLLGAIGTSAIIEPLERVARTDPSPSYRATALGWLTQGPWELASPIIRQAATDDQDEAVKETARQLLAAHEPK